MSDKSPRRRVTQLRSLGIEDIARRLQLNAPEITLGWSALLDDLNAAGWPARSDDGQPNGPRNTVRCQCGAGFETVDQWRYHSDETGHDEHREIAHEAGNSLDYADPTGELGVELDRLHKDRAELEDLRNSVEKALRRMQQIAARHRPVASPAVPACSVSQCPHPVEHRVLSGGGLSYRGMVLIAGMWCGKPGARPVCAGHRTNDRRDPANEGA